MFVAVALRWQLAKSLAGNRWVVFNTILSVMSGLVSGIWLPICVANLLNGLANRGEVRLGQLTVAVGLMAAVQIAQALVEMRGVTWLRLQTLCRLAGKLRGAYSDLFTEAEISRALKAYELTARVIWGELPALMVGLGGFLIVLLSHGLPWWVYLAFVGLVAASVSVYWAVKNVTTWAAAATAENESVTSVAQLANESGKQFQPALYKDAVQTAETAAAARHLANRLPRLYLSLRIIVGGLLLLLAAFTAVHYQLAAGTLFVVFALTFSGHLANIHYVVSSLIDIRTDCRKAAAILAREPLPVFKPVHGDLRLEIDGDPKVVYASPGQRSITVFLEGLLPKLGGLVFLRDPNGRGKSTLFRVLAGLQAYKGSLRLGGTEIRGHDMGSVVALLQQEQKGLNVPVRTLFWADGQRVDKQLRNLVLAWANVDFPLGNTHAKLSGGQRQKANLALLMYQAVREAPPVLLLDEPLNHLDLRTREHLYAHGLPAFFKRYLEATKGEGAVTVVAHADDHQAGIMAAYNAQ